LSLGLRVLSRLMGLPPATHPHLDRQHDIPATMPDGTVLLADRWFPRGQDGTLPTLLMRSPYGRRGVMTFEAPLLAQRGYNVVIQSTRGTHGSGGEFDAFVHERSDGAATLAWLHQQPWCDGRVATFGGSYCGYTQLAAAADAAPGQISAQSAGVTSADLRWLLKPYGVVGVLGAASWLYGLDTQGERSLLAGLRHAARGRRAVARATATLPVLDVDVAATREKQPFYRSWVESDWESPYWQGLDVRAGHRTQTAPIALQAGWFDIFARGQLDDATELLAAGRDVRLVVGPWHHAAGAGVRMREALRWFSRAFGGVSEEDPSPVRVQLYGDQRWYGLPSWPPTSVSYRWFLGTGSVLAQQPPAGTERVEWVNDPMDPAPSVGGAVLLRGGAKDNSEREARDDVLVFTSAPLEDDLVVLGAPVFRAATNADVPSYDVVVRLCVVDAKGVSRNVSDGLQRVLGAAADVEVQMWPTGVRFRRGERIRVQVSGALHPMFARNLHTGEPAATAVESRVALQGLQLGGEHPAVLELPVVRLGPADVVADL
jgi:putative CocE/NonD family hydrolase